VNSITLPDNASRHRWMEALRQLGDRASNEKIVYSGPAPEWWDHDGDAIVGLKWVKKSGLPTLIVRKKESNEV
jgi:hypothetical protein